MMKDKIGGECMNEEDKLSKKELDYIVNQLKQTQKETAATIAVESAGPFRRIQQFKSLLVGMGIGIILGLVILVAGFVYLQKEETLKSASAIESIQNLSTLATAQVHIKTILSKEDNELFGKSIPFDFPGSKRTLFLVVPGEVTAGVDLKNLDKNDVALDNETKTIEITLPHAAIIQSPSIDLENIQTFSSEGIFRSEVNWEEGFQLGELAKQNIKEEAIQSGLLKTAEDNARIALQDFFKNLDYTAKITFE